MTQEETRKRLAEFFPARDVKAIPKNIRNGTALAMFYIDARAIEERLDDVFGPFGWKDSYELSLANNGLIICHLSIWSGLEWVTKCDAASTNKKSNLDENDRQKAVFSGALKRAAVKWGIGRYLYSIPTRPFPFNEQYKSFSPRPLPPLEFLPADDPERKNAVPLAEYGRRKGQPAPERRPDQAAPANNGPPPQRPTPPPAPPAPPAGQVDPKLSAKWTEHFEKAFLNCMTVEELDRSRAAMTPEIRGLISPVDFNKIKLAYQNQKKDILDSIKANDKAASVNPPF